MREHISEVFLFIYTTLSYWEALATGGIVTGMVGIFERLSGYHLKKRAYISLFVGTFLLVAFFLAWHEERAERLRQAAEINRLLSTKTRLEGHFEYIRFDSNPGFPSKIGITMVIGVSNTGMTPSIADRWVCYLNLRRPNGETYRVLGEQRPIPSIITVSRGTSEPLVFDRDDALYVKTMKAPIIVGAKVVGVLIYYFPIDVRDDLRSSNKNTITVEFKDVLGETHEITLNYVPLSFDANQESGWIDIPGLDRPTNQPPS